jgi:hypothetical protein
MVEKLIKKHIDITEKDNEKLQAIKEQIGAVTDAAGIRVAIRKYQVEQ